MKVSVHTDISWNGAIVAIEQLAKKIAADRPLYFSLFDAERLEAVVRTIRSTCPQESQ